MMVVKQNHGSVERPRRTLKRGRGREWYSWVAAELPFLLKQIKRTACTLTRAFLLHPWGGGGKVSCLKRTKRLLVAYPMAGDRRGNKIT